MLLSKIILSGVRDGDEGALGLPDGAGFSGPGCLTSGRSLTPLSLVSKMGTLTEPTPRIIVNIK